jgi:hypothetical protein
MSLCMCVRAFKDSFMSPWNETVLIMAEKNGYIKNLHCLYMNGVHGVWIHSQMEYRKVALMLWCGFENG